MKKLIIPIIISALLFSGCRQTGNATEIGKRAIIQAAAVDFDNGYRVSALLFSSGGSGGDTIDATQENVIKVTGEGRTLAEAIDNISLIDGKTVYMCETKLLILGGGFELASVRDALGTLYFDMRCSLNMPVCCADNAEALTDLTFREGITSAEKPLSLIENANLLGVSPKVTLLDLLSDDRAGRTTLIPRFAITENGRGMTASEDGKTAVLSGSRELTGGKLGKYYNSTQTAGKMLLEGISDKVLLNYFHNGNECTCEAYAIKVYREEKSDDMLTVTARFRSRKGGTLSEEERASAMNSLTRIIECGL
ncbi:MAG: hypothetical protein ACI4QY_03415 [Oscillospiraceae bacterium]